jgi:hypothetical protein
VGPVFEPGGGAPPNLGLGAFKPGLGNLYTPPNELADARLRGNPVPMNPALSQASVLASTPPALQQDPVDNILKGMDKYAGGSAPFGFNPGAIFFDPSRARRW